MSSSMDDISISSIFTTPATTGCHMLKIDGYSQTKLFFGRGYRAASPTFEAAGQKWYISYYPYGTSASSASADYISLFINPCSPITAGTTRAKIRFSLVPHVGNPPPPPYCKSFVLVVPFDREPGRNRDVYGFPFFIKREELEKSEYLVDDCFAIRCDVEVTKLLSSAAAAADPAVSAHDLERLALPCTCDDDQCKRHRLPRAVEAASPQCRDGGDDDVAGVDKSPETADRACACKDGLCKCKHSAVEAPPPQPQRRRRAMAAWFRLFPGSGKSETETTGHQATCTSLKKPLLSEIN
ncbi:unnamed protein product [Urochloa decumbens]|uniref:MATH domain-containing protein n=1 Tax=Urochloa decumbens TaxID=240449 RepID=A0ABC9FZS2_9POAL